MSDRDVTGPQFVCREKPTPPKEMAVSESGGLRDNKGKIRVSLTPYELITGVAEVFWKSSKPAGGKYPLYNWQKGLPQTEVCESALRHIYRFLAGEDLDPETGLHHLKHAACNLAILLWYLVHRPETDDRKKEIGK